MSVATDAIEGYLVSTAEQRLAQYMDFIRIPSIGGIPAHAPDMRRAAEALAADFSAAGLENVEVVETAGHPVVYADWLHAPDGAPTVLVYAHYDVQPADPAELWSFAPFEPAIVDGRMLGRGSADDKAMVQMHIAAVGALLATRGSLPLNMKFLIEGEEEISSPSLPALLAANRDRLKADLAICSDTGFFEGNIPAICIGVRGVCNAQVDVCGPSTDLHSGLFGGAVINPATALVEMLAALKDRTGHITIPGFYDEVVELSELDRTAMAALPFDDEAWAGTVGGTLGGETGFSTLERLGGRPTCDVCGLWGGFSGEGPKTIIPSEAHAKVSFRLVANQDPATIFELFSAYVKQIAPAGLRVEVSALGMGRGTLAPIDHPANKALARAIEAVYGVEPLYFRQAASIPAVAMMEEGLGVPVVFFSNINPDCRAHAPNESMLMANFESGIRAFARAWDELGAVPAETLRG